LDDGNTKETVKLDSPNIGLYIGKNMWREMYDFSPNCVLIVLANEYYDENEYIRNYEDFLKIIKK
jgi:dTDP-4-dehydrorhamnose 3,5-epimerase-like enzyme